MTVVSGACLTAMLGFAAGPAAAAYKAQVQTGTLQIVGDGASDKLELIRPRHSDHPRARRR